MDGGIPALRLLNRMKKLYLMRHAKSSWEEPGVPDFSRPLVSKGVRKTGRIIGYLTDHGVTADLILSSPAVRALETARLVAAGIGYPAGRIRTERVIYGGNAEHILDLIFTVPDEVESLILFGHNPVITDLANFFLRPGIDDMPTSCMVGLSFEAKSWTEIPSASSATDFIIYPKILK